VISAQTLGTMEHTLGWKFINTTIDVSTKVIEKKKVESIADEERLKQ
jgi:hypothetical protein